MSLIATLGPTWNSTLVDFQLASLNLQVGPQSGIIIVRNRPASRPHQCLRSCISVFTDQSLSKQSLVTPKSILGDNILLGHTNLGLRIFLDTINATLGSILDFLGKLKIWQVPTCKMEPQSGSIIIVRHWHADRSTGQPMTGQPSDIINVWGPVSQVLLIRACPNNVL